MGIKFASGATMKKYFLSTLLTVVFISATTQLTYAGSNSEQGHQTQAVKDKAIRIGNWKSSFSFIDTKATNFELALNPNNTVDVDGVTVSGQTPSEEDNLITKECVDSTIAPAFVVDSVLVGLFEFVGDKLATYFVGKVEDKLSSILESYSDAYLATYSPDYFYQKSASPRELAVKCFRFVRTYTETEIDENGEPKLVAGLGGIKEVVKRDKIAMEFIGQIRLTESSSALKIRPLRLALFKSKTKSTNDEVALSIALNIDSVWLKDGVGLSDGILNIHFPTQRIKGEKDLRNCNIDSLSKVNKKECKEYNKKPLTKFNEIGYFGKTEKNIKNWTTENPLPLIPISDGATAEGGDIAITMSVAEAGTPPKYLEDLIAFFDSQKDDLETQLKDAFTSLLGE